MANDCHRPRYSPFVGIYCQFVGTDNFYVCRPKLLSFNVSVHPRFTYHFFVDPKFLLQKMTGVGIGENTAGQIYISCIDKRIRALLDETVAHLTVCPLLEYSYILF